MLGGGVYVKQNKKMPGTYINLKSRNMQEQENKLPQNTSDGIFKLKDEIIEARGEFGSLDNRLDNMEAVCANPKIATKESLGVIKVGDGLGIRPDGNLFAYAENVMEAMTNSEIEEICK